MHKMLTLPASSHHFSNDDCQRIRGNIIVLYSMCTTLWSAVCSATHVHNEQFLNWTIDLGVFFALRLTFLPFCSCVVCLSCVRFPFSSFFKSLARKNVLCRVGRNNLSQSIQHKILCYYSPTEVNYLANFSFPKE